MSAAVVEAERLVKDGDALQESLIEGYSCIAGLWKSPERMDRAEVDARFPHVIVTLSAHVSVAAADSLERFWKALWDISDEEYTGTLELSPSAPPYMGHYNNEEPSTCMGLGQAPRNQYMIDLVGIYKHWGLAPETKELPDYLPMMVEFLWLSLRDPPAQADSGTEPRLRFIGAYLGPSLPTFIETLRRIESPYLHLALALDHMLLAEMPGLEATRLEDSRPPNVVRIDDGGERA